MTNKLERTCKKQLSLLVRFGPSVCYDALKKKVREREIEKACYESRSPSGDHKPSSSQKRSSSVNYYTAKFVTRTSLFNTDSCSIIPFYGNYMSTATAVSYLQRTVIQFAASHPF